jgi:methylase of polypeptide subunit release factors
MKVAIYHQGIDINPLAVQTSGFNADLNNLSQFSHFSEGNLFSSLLSDKERQPYDLIIFNPPYLASESEIIAEENRQWIDLAWEGGDMGYEITLTFFHQLTEYLKSGSELMFISSSRVDQAPLLSALQNLNMEIIEVFEQKVFFEQIFLYYCKKE